MSVGTPLAISGIRGKRKKPKKRSISHKRKRASGKITCRMQVVRGGHRRRVCRDSLGRIVAQKKRSSSRRSSRRRKRS